MASGIGLEAGVGAETGAGGPSQLAADSLLLPDDVPDALGNKLVVALVVRLCRAVGPALGGGEDFKLRLGNALALAVHVGQSVVAIGGAHEHEHAFGPLSDGWVAPRGENDVRQVGHGLLQRRVCASGVLPYLVCVRRQVYVALRVAVQNAGALVVQIDDGLIIVFVLEERLVSANDLCVLAEPGPDSPAQVDDALNPLGGQEGVAEYLLPPSALYGRRGPPAG